MLLDLEATGWALSIAALFFVLIEVGFKIASRIEKHSTDEAPFGVIQGAAFALVGLLLGFSFSLAVQRFDARRAEVVSEANAIGTAALRVRLLDPSAQPQMFDKLREYVDVRVAFSLAGTKDEAGSTSLIARSDALQAQIWKLAMISAQKDPHSTEVPLFVAALNTMIDEGAAQQAVLHASIPPAVLGVLGTVVMLSAPLLGVGFGRAQQRNIAAAAIFSVMLAVVVSIILDLDRPQRGLVSVDLTPLRQVQQSLHSAASGPAP